MYMEEGEIIYGKNWGMGVLWTHSFGDIWT